MAGETEDITENMEVKRTAASAGRKPVGAVMVVGGGIAGVQASLDLADMGYLVYLVESGPSIGGVMGQLDKTFPTNDCSMCILSPKLVEVGSNDNIEVLTLSDVIAVSGEPGDFTVKVLVNPRFVDIDKCTGCGICSEHCPVKVKDPFNAGLVKVPLIRVPFPQAIPNAAFIDPRKCLQILKGKCGECEKACPAGAINYKEVERIREIGVGAVVVAAGYRPFDAGKVPEYGYGLFDNVVTSLEFERILVANGPTAGHVVRPSDSRPAKRIAFIQCVGSRDSRIGNKYCSSVCCMYATKQSIIACEHEPEVSPTIFYIDMRAYGKGFEAYQKRAESEYGVRYVRCLPSAVKELEPSKNLLISYATEEGEVKEEEFDLVVLSIGIECRLDDLANALDLPLDECGFVSTKSFSPVETAREGMYVCGAAESPKDIPDSVVQASAAAGFASRVVSESRHALTAQKDYPPERDVSGEEPRIGAIICRCGTNIGGVVDVPAVVEYGKTLPGVVFSSERLYACSQDTQEWIKEVICEHRLNRLVVAACTPRTHQPLFRETMREAGLNKYLFEMANIREHCSWVHMNQPDKATEKAKRLVFMAVEKARRLEPLPEGVSPVIPRALVIGGGAAGMTAALQLADAGFPTYLVERETELGGHMRHVNHTIEGEDVYRFADELIGKVKSHPLIELFLSHRVVDVQGFVGSFRTVVAPCADGGRAENPDSGSGEACPGPRTLEHGIIIVATGAGEYRPRRGEYMYGMDERVITQSQLEEILKNDPWRLRGVKSVVMIQCVGSRNEEHPYCSKICCGVAVKNACELKAINPGISITVCYRDIRTYGFSEKKCFEAREKGVLFARFTEEEPPAVESSLGRLTVRVCDKNMRGREMTLFSDLVVLSCGVVTDPEARELAPKLKVPLTPEGFFLEAHVKLRPVEFATDGVFIAGMAHYPKTIRESVASALAAAGKAEAVLSKQNIVTEGIVARVNQEICSGCRQCVSLCYFEAIVFDEEKGAAWVNPSLCKGCGACTAACASGASELLGFKRGQIYAQIKASCAGLLD